MVKKTIFIIACCFLISSQISYSKDFWGQGITWFSEDIQTIVQYKPEHEFSIDLPYQTVYRNIRGALTACVLTDNFRYITGELYSDIKSGEIYHYFSGDIAAILTNIIYIEHVEENKTLVKSWARSITMELPGSKYISKKIEYGASQGFNADCSEFDEPVEKPKTPLG